MSVAEHSAETQTTTTPLLEVTQLAAERLSSMMRERELEGYALRVFVSGGGCSGLQYGMTFDDEVREGDNDFTSSELRILVDPVSARYLQGASVDYVDNLMGGGFKIENPNAVSGCGCGHSFRTEEEGNDAEEQSSGGGCSTCSSY
ncbi:MAG: iron-sulfur cluster insertion protein ErpA [Chloroflexaceae bacterium]